MRLLLCGNGFDLHHGLETGYSNYRHYLQNHGIHILTDFERFPWLNDLCKGDLWKDVEHTLAIDFKKMCEYLNRLYISEDALVELHGDLEDWTRFIYSFTGEEFYKWLLSIDFRKASTDCMISKLLEESVCVNFNYTDTIERIYGILPDNVLHIHGKSDAVCVEECLSHSVIPSFASIEEAEIKADEVIEADKWNSDIIRDEIQFGAPFFGSIQNVVNDITSRCEDENINQMLREFVEKTVKCPERNVPKLEAFLKGKYISDVHILGLSLSDTDDYYFTEILIPRYKDCTWHFYFHGEKDEDAEGDRKLKRDYAESHSINCVEFHRW